MHVVEDQRGDAEAGDHAGLAGGEDRRSPGRPRRSWRATGDVAAGQVLGERRRDLGADRLRVEPGGAELVVVRRRHASRPSPGPARTPGCWRRRSSRRRSGRRSRASSRSGKSSRQCEPRVSSRSAAASASAALMREQVGGLPRLLVDDLGRRRRPACRAARRRRPARRRCAARRPARSSPPGGRGAAPPGTRPGGARGRRPAAAAGAARRAAPSAIRREKTRPSSSELEASRLAPCTPEQATSPVAYRPGTLLRPHRSVRTPPEA